MSNINRRYTSLMHTDVGNYQIDFSGCRATVVIQFEDWFNRRNGAMWGKLFEERSGKLVASVNQDEIVKHFD